MKIEDRHSFYFLIVKLLQLLACVTIIVLEAISYFTWSQYVDELDSSGLYPELNKKITKSLYFEKKPLVTDPSITYNGEVKIWYYIVIIITVLGTIIYLSRYRWLWGQAMRLILTELFFFLLWFSAGIANFDPWFRGPGLRCDLIKTDYVNVIIEKLAELAQLQCNTQVASLSFCWINVGLYILSLFIARKRLTELAWANMSTYNNNRASQQPPVDRYSSRLSSRTSRYTPSRYTSGSGSPAIF